MDQHSSQDYQVLLYYNFVSVPDPEAVRAEMEEFCIGNRLKGRILIAKEGLNGTVSGLATDTIAYMDWLGQHPVFHSTEFKIDPSEHHTFLKLHVRVKEEIVNFGVGDLNPNSPLDNYIEPDEFRRALKSENEDIIFLDARSNYEHKVGKFKGALTLDIDNFRELPGAIEELEHLKDKKIYTYCTGGIKCEKVSRYMIEQGFENVFQLHGGIVRYGHEAEGEDFEGSCYVFDQRVVVPVNTSNPTTIGECHLCSGKTDVMVNCANSDCNLHFLICETCAQEKEGCCSNSCMTSPKRRVYDGKGYYLRGVNSKLYTQTPDPNYIRMKGQ